MRPFSLWAYLVAQWQRIHLPTQETWVQSLGQEDSLEKEMAAHSSILSWENPMDRGAYQATVYRVTKRVKHDLGTKTTMITMPFYIEANS